MNATLDRVVPQRGETTCNRIKVFAFYKLGRDIKIQFSINQIGRHARLTCTPAQKNDHFSDSQSAAIADLHKAIKQKFSLKTELLHLGKGAATIRITLW